MGKGGFVTISPRHLPVAAPDSSSSSGKSSFAATVPVWESRYSDEEMVYYVSLVEKQPLVIFATEEATTMIVGVLKLLHPSCACICVSPKTQRQQVSKLIRKSITHSSGILVLTPDTALFAQSCMPQNVVCRTVVHCVPIDSFDQWKKRSSLLVARLEDITSNNISSFGKQIIVSRHSSGKSQGVATPRYCVQTGCMSGLQARVAVARKLVVASSEASTVWRPGSEKDEGGGGSDGGEDRERRQGLAGRLEALRSKLKVLTSKPLVGIVSTTPAPKASPSSSPSAAAAPQPPGPKQGESNKALRSKMLLLGMLHVPGKVELEKQAQSGRSLAVTRWMDGVSGKSVGADWDTFRFGASCDGASRDAREAVEAFRGYLSLKAGRALPKRHLEASVASRKVLRHLCGCRIVAFGWRPSAFGDVETWGGKFGKCCGHNEVAMFFTRPWVPLEVLNTHVCSKASPAPGNEGHDGCLEFLTAQCRFFSRSYSIWDDKFFYNISKTGTVSTLEKASLLSFSEGELKVLVPNLKRLTVEEAESPRPTRELIAYIKLLLALNNQQFSTTEPSFLRNPKIAKLVVSFLLAFPR